MRLAVVLLFLASPLLAYTDPGSGILFFQMLMASLAGVFFSLRKFTNWFSRKDRK